MTILLIVGVALIVFGLLLLLKFPDRPGGKVALGKVEVSSTGAGLPLVVIGVVCLVLGVRGAGDNSGTGGNSNAVHPTPTVGTPPTPNVTPVVNATPTATPNETPTPAQIATPQPTATPGSEGGSEAHMVCLARQSYSRTSSSTGVPKLNPMRVGTIPVELGARDTRLGTNGELPGVVRVPLYDGGAFVGLIQLSPRAAGGNYLFRVSAVFDGECRAVSDLENAKRGGDPKVLQNWDTLRFRMNGTAYEARFGYGSDIGVEVSYFNKL